MSIEGVESLGKVHCLQMLQACSVQLLHPKPLCGLSAMSTNRTRIFCPKPLLNRELGAAQELKRSFAAWASEDSGLSAEAAYINLLKVGGLGFGLGVVVWD